MNASTNSQTNQAKQNGHIKSKHRFGLRTKLIALVSGGLLLVVILATLITGWIGQSTLTEITQQNLTNETNSKNELIRAQLIWARSVAIDLAAGAEVVAYDEESIKAAIRNTLYRNEQVFGSTIAYEPDQFTPGLYYWSPYYSRTPTNELVFTQLGNPEYNYFQWKWYTWPKQAGKPVLSPPYYDEGGGEIWMVTWSAPFFTPDGAFKGVATADISFAQTQAIVNNIQVGETGYAFLLDSQGTILGIGGKAGGNYQAMTSSMVETAQSAGASAWAELIAKMQAGQTGFTPEAIPDPQQRPMFVAYAPIGLGTDWSLALAFPEDELLAPITRMRTGLIISALLLVLLFGVVLYFFTGTIVRPINILVKQAGRLAKGELKLVEGQLEEPIQVRTGDELEELAVAFNQMATDLQQSYQNLAQRARRLELVVTVGERLSALLDLEVLLAETVNQVQAQFGYYHAHIYLLDTTSTSSLPEEGGPAGVLVVAAGSPAAGVELETAAGSRALTGPASLTAGVLHSGQVTWAENVRLAEGWQPEPLLPRAYAEIAVPIILDGQVIGVLDVQEDEIGGLTEEDANVLRAVVNQVVVAMRNAGQFEQVQAALVEARALQAQYVEQAWEIGRISRQKVEPVCFSLEHSAPLTEEVIAQARQIALTRVEPVQTSLNDGPEMAYLAPVTLRNVAIGNLQIHGLDPGRPLTDSDTALIVAIVDQVAQTAENLRLFDETRQRGDYERLAGEMTQKIRQAPNLEILAQTAAEMLNEVLGAAGGEVRLNLSSQAKKGNGHGR